MTASGNVVTVGMVMNDSNGMNIHSPRNGLIEHEVVTNDSNTSFPACDELIGHHEIVNIDGTELLNIDVSNGITALTDCNGTVFLLVTSSTEEEVDNIDCNLRNRSSSCNSRCNDNGNNNDSTNDHNTCISNGGDSRNHKVLCKSTLVKNASNDGKSGDCVNRDTGNRIDNCTSSSVVNNQKCANSINTWKTLHCSSVETGCSPSPQLQIINRDGIAVDINVNELLATLDALKRDETPTSIPNIRNETSTSIRNIHDETPTSIPNIHDETPASIPNIRDETPASIPNTRDETPASIPNININHSIDSNPNVIKAEVEQTDLSSRDAVRNLTSVVERANVVTNSRSMHPNKSSAGELNSNNTDNNSRNNENCTSCQVSSCNSSINSNTSSNSSNNSNCTGISNHHTAMTNTHPDVPLQSDPFVMGNKMPRVPNWAMCLQDCSLQGDMFIGYVRDENEVDVVLNLYKKETQSLFATRQTPSPAKDDGGGSDAVRLMWKSQYVPYDGIPFVNMGRRATVMECEFGPRKRNNAIKRMMQMRSAVLAGNPPSAPKSPVLTCPVRLFVKKVLKFPQYRVSRDADAKVLRQLQEQSLKHVRESGFQKGEVRWYIQFPLPSSHRYHNCGPPLDVLPKEAKNTNTVVAPSDTSFIDNRVLAKIQQIVRQGFVNPFLVRTATKEFVENQMKLHTYEQVPLKHNKHFYPPLIEIQNIIQQTQAALKAGMITPLPTPTCPLVTQKAKRKRYTSEEGDGISTHDASRVVKRMAVHHQNDNRHGNGPHRNSASISNAAAAGNADAGVHSTMASSESLMTSPEPSDEGGGGREGEGEGGGETISLTLTDTQLNNLSLNNFTYTQLAQLAKIGLLALNNATKDTMASQDEDTIAAQSNVAADIKLKTESEESDDDSTQTLPHNCSSAYQASPLPHNCGIASTSDDRNNGKGPMCLSGVSDCNGLGTSSSRLTNVDVVR